MAIPGGIAAIAWVDATNIKINPSKNAPLVGAREWQALPVAVLGVYVLLRNPFLASCCPFRSLDIYLEK
jgi:hypothetical protein